VVRWVMMEVLLFFLDEAKLRIDEIRDGWIQLL
jgi:hypothetical protein